MAKEITCTVCPLSCNVVLELGDNGEILSLTGNKCARGKVYATKEHENPERTLTTIVKVQGGAHVAAKVQAKAPIAMGDVIIKDFLNLGVDLVASRDL